MNSIKLPFTSELRGGGRKNSAFKIMNDTQLETKMNKRLKMQLKSGSIVNYVKKIIFPNTSLLNVNTNNKSNNKSNNRSKPTIKYIKASETKEYYRK
jgi:hypothetical protein